MWKLGPRPRYSFSGIMCFKFSAFYLCSACSKTVGETTIVLWIRPVSEEFQHSVIQTKIVQSFGGFFHQIKVPQPIGRRDSIQTIIRTSRRLDSFLFLIFRTEIKEIKNQKPISDDAPFKAYPLVPLSCRSNLAGRYL
jgi:hypothetical protein